MLNEANDFRAECDALAAILVDADDTTFQKETLFKNWTIEDVIAHLHMWNYAAVATLESREKFQEFFVVILKGMGAGKGHPEIQRDWLNETQNGVSGRVLYDAWAAFYPILSDAYLNADPETRVAWAGPDMSVGAKIIARQMETWAHGQEVFDVLGEDRLEADRIKNIVELGVRTYSWTFRNRGEEPPAPKPFVDLTSPSGANWQWNEQQGDNVVAGSAVDFARVVTQTRNVADTTLVTTGEAATRWMSLAQCFAGVPETPPARGARHKA